MGRLPLIALSGFLWLLGVLGIAYPDAVPSELAFLLVGLGLGTFAGGILLQPREKLNPWAVQRLVMAKSGQQLPHFPALTSTSILYLALIMEELSEAMLHAYEVIERDRLFPPLNRKPDEFVDAWRFNLAACLRGTSLDLSGFARDLRTRMTAVIPWEIRLTPDEARDLLDDANDIAVVTCGFNEATGLPGAEGYEEVQRSNLSKANPATGKIDKDPSGKWIKGSNYTPPDLDRVIFDHLGRDA